MYTDLLQKNIYKKKKIVHKYNDMIINIMNIKKMNIKKNTNIWVIIFRLKSLNASLTFILNQIRDTIQTIKI